MTTSAILLLVAILAWIIVGAINLTQGSPERGGISRLNYGIIWFFYIVSMIVDLIKEIK